jgi:hypothetical protein
MKREEEERAEEIRMRPVSASYRTKSKKKGKIN